MRLDLGIIAALASAVLFGATIPLAKPLLARVDPVLLAGLMYLSGGLALTGWLTGRRAWGVAVRPLSVHELPWLFGVIVLGGLLGPVLLFAGLRSTSAVAGSLLLNLEVVFTAVIAWRIFREPYDRRLVVGVLAIAVGGMLLSWAGPGHASWGAFAIIGACLCWGIENNLSRRLAASDPVRIAAIKGGVAGAANVALALSMGSRWPDLAMLAVIGAIGVLGYGASLVLFMLALPRIGAARTAAYFAAAPFVGAVLAVLTQHEPLPVLFWPALAFMAVGLGLHLRERHTHVHEHQPMLHTHRHVHDEHHQHEHDFRWDGREPHTHEHAHGRLRHDHPHFPDLHHRHRH